MRWDKIKEQGMSLPEIIVAVGIAGIVALPATTMVKNFNTGQTDFKEELEKTETVKLIEIRARAKDGCTALVGKAPGEPISIELRPGTIVTGNTKVGEIFVSDFRFENFVPTNKSGSMGIAEIKVAVSHSHNNKASIMRFPMPVRMESGKVKDCSYGNIRDFQELVDELCSEAYGIVSKDLSCIEIVAKFQKLATEEICQELYGATPSALAGGRCDLGQIHVGKKCPPGQLLVGFKSQNEVDCDP